MAFETVIGQFKESILMAAVMNFIRSIYTYMVDSMSVVLLRNY